MIKNDLGFILAKGLPFTAYDKVIEGNKKTFGCTNVSFNQYNSLF